MNLFFNCASLTAIYVDKRNEKYISDGGVLFSKDKTILIQYPAGKTATTYTIPDSVVKINQGAFNNSRLLSIILPNDITSISAFTFVYCINLKSITIPNTVTTIDNFAFCGCSTLVGFNVDPKNNNYTSEDGILYNKIKDEIIRYPAGRTSEKFIIPSNVTTISSGAFQDCINLKEVIIPESLTFLGNYAFQNCSNLETIVWPNSVMNHISDDSFDNCDNLIIYGKQGSNIQKYAEENNINFQAM